MNYQAIIFDLDGVLIDAELIYRRHWQNWAARHEVSFDHILKVHHGSPALRTMEMVAPHLDAISESRQFNRQLEGDMDMEGTFAFPGVEDVLSSLPVDRWAITTSAPRKIALARLAYLDLPTPAVLVAPEDVLRGKPAPDPYLKAAKELGFAAEDCLVIEDAPAGIEGALAARTQVLALATTHKQDDLLQAHVICTGIIVDY
ncbi:MAG: HAD-IA family hydrolase [Saprospiraceae bacterium]|nr:HAD-IA family hydrolase [Saprospiraceae bacterium]